MKIQLIIITILLFGVNQLFAQNARFTHSGVITFEKSINQHAAIKKMMGNNPYFGGGDDYKKSVPQFKVLKSTLTFSNNKTLYRPVPEEETPMGMFGSFGSEQSNIIYTDVASNIFTSEKKLFEETFLVKDSTQQINWKLTSEMRDIAGYECRRANAIIMDSIYVVAFYTDKIPVSGGPESFTGLPGMILGVALPHDNITWFAKTVTDKSIPSTEIQPPVKGKATNSKGLFETITKILGNYGGKADRALKLMLL